MTDQLSLGVIGHVDHGKTTLVKALTGMETDRLKEEKQRGLSIVLGFAYLETTRGLIDFIDTPGHSDFVRTMISGVSGIDAALIVISANEKIMPQTVEHIRIVSLLGIEHAVVALTKTDLATDDEIKKATAEITAYLADTAFSGVTVVPVSAPTGAGMDELVDALNGLFDVKPKRADVGHFYLPFDRVFSIKGFGTVGTGTLSGGAVSVGDVAEIAPSGRKARVRSLEVHGASVDRALPGQRVAANIRIDGTGDIARGNTLTSPEWLPASTYWDGNLHLLSDAPKELKSGTKLRVLHGTTEEIATIRLLDRERLQPGDTAPVQFRLAEPAVAWHQERFIVRSVTPVQTIGGGQFTDTQAKQRRRGKQAAVPSAKADARTTALMSIVTNAGTDGISLAELGQRVDLDEADLRTLCGQNGCAIEDNGLVFDGKVFEATKSSIEKLVGAFHEANPKRLGLAQSEIASRLKAPLRLFRFALATLANEKVLEIAQGTVRLTSFDPFAQLRPDERKILDALEARLIDQGITAPTLKELTEENPKYKDISRFLVDTNRAIAVFDEKRKNLFFFHHTAIDAAADALRHSFPPPAAFTASEAREALGTTRKYVMPLLGHLDKQKITLRRDDKRTLAT